MDSWTSKVSGRGRGHDAPGSQGRGVGGRGQRGWGGSQGFPKTEQKTNQVPFSALLSEDTRMPKNVELWIREPTPLSTSSDAPSTDPSLIIKPSALVHPSKAEVFCPQGVYGDGIASQMLADAPYFFTDPFAARDTPSKKIVKLQPIEPLYNLTHYYAPTGMANTYLLDRVLKPLLDPRCNFHERFALEVYRQDACRRMVEEIRAMGYAVPALDPKSPVYDQYHIITTLRSMLLKSLGPHTTPLMKHYNTTREFGMHGLRLPGSCYFQVRDKKGKLKPEDIQQRFIEWLSGRVLTLRRAEEHYAKSLGGDRGLALAAFVDVLNARRIALPSLNHVVADGDGDDLGVSVDDVDEAAVLNSVAVSTSASLFAYKHGLRNQVGYYVHYNCEGGKVNPIGNRNSLLGGVYRGLAAKGDVVSVAMKGWFDLREVLGPRKDRKARRDAMRARGELPQIYDPTSGDCGRVELPETISAEDSTHSAVVAQAFGINIHRKMMYHHTAIIDPTLAVSSPNRALPKKEANHRDLSSPSAAVAYLRRMRAADSASDFLHTDLNRFQNLPQVQQFQIFADKMRDHGVEELRGMIKSFDIRLGTVHAKEGAANEIRVWRENVPRIIKQILTPRFGQSLSHGIVSFKEKDLGPISPAETEFDTMLRSFYCSALEEGEGSLALVSFWVTKCQLMRLTSSELLAVQRDPRFVRMESYFYNSSDAFITNTYRVRHTISVEDISKREKSLDGEAVDPLPTEEGRRGATKDEADSIRTNLLKYLAFWIHCDLLNRRLEAKGLGPLPFFHFVTVNTRYASNADPEKWLHVGELDGLLLDLGGKAPQLVNIFEIKANPADLTSAWKQRERFLSTIWTAFCRPKCESFVCPLHLNWYSMRGEPRPTAIGDSPVSLAPGEVTSVSFPYSEVSPGEVAIYPAAVGDTVLPPFYQLIFPLFSFNASALFASRASVDDLGRPLILASNAIEILRQRVAAPPPANCPLPTVHPEVYRKMLNMWIFTSFIIVTKEGIPIIPQWRLQGMGSFRHTLCNGAAVVYASGRRAPAAETWAEATLPTGTVGKLRAARERHTDPSTQIVGPWLKELESLSPQSLISTSNFKLPDRSFFVFSAVFYSAVKYQTSKVTKAILCPQELVSELSRSGSLSSLLLIPKFESEQYNLQSPMD